MTETIGPMLARIDQQQLAQEFVDSARAEGVELVDPGGVLTGLTKTVLEAAAGERFEEFAQLWGSRYPAIVTLWRNAWSEFVPFLDYDVEIRRVICSTNAKRPLPASDQSPRALPHALETSTERFRDHLRGPYRPLGSQLTTNASYTGHRTLPEFFKLPRVSINARSKW